VLDLLFSLSLSLERERERPKEQSARTELYYEHISPILGKLLLFLLYMYMLYKDTHHIIITRREFKEEVKDNKG